MVKRRSTRQPRRRGDREPEQVLYVERGAAVGATVMLDGAEADHARRSLRLRTGDPVSVVDGAGSRFHGVISGLDKHHVAARLDRVELIEPWPHRELWLGAGVLKSTRMDVVVEKASELGVSRLFPVLFKHCVSRPHEDGAKVERWRRIAVESLKQCKRARLMQVEEPVTLEAFLEHIPADAELVVADPEGVAPRSPVARGTLVLTAAPEGGIAPDELETLSRMGARRVRLDGNRLRAETAALALVVSLLAVSGDFGLKPGNPPADNGL